MSYNEQANNDRSVRTLNRKELISVPPAKSLSTEPKDSWVKYAQSLEEQLSTINKNNEAFESRAKDRLLQIDKLQEKINLLEREKQEYSTKIEDYEHCQQERDEALEQLKITYEQLELLDGDKNAAIEQASSKVKQIEEDYKNLWQRYQQAQSNLSSSETLEIEHEKNLLAIVKLQAELDRAVSAIEDAEFKVQQYSRYGEELNHQKKVAENAIKELENKADQFKIEAEDTRNKYNLLLLQLEKAKKDRDEHQTAERDLKVKLLAVQGDFNKLNGQHERNVENIGVLESELASLRGESKKIGLELQVAVQERDQLKRHAATVSTAAEQYRQQFEEVNARGKGYEQKLLEITEKLKAKEDETATIARANEKAQAILVSMEKKLAQAIEKQNASAKENASLQLELERISAEREDAARRYALKDNDIRNLQNALNKTQLQIQTLNEHIKTQEISLRGMEKTKQELKRTQGLLVDYKSGSDNLSAELGTLKEYVKKLESETNSAKRNEQEYLQALREKTETLDAVERDYEALKNKEEALRLDLVTVEQQSRSASEALYKLTHELKDLGEKEKKERIKAEELERANIAYKAALDSYGNVPVLQEEFAALKEANYRIEIELRKSSEHRVALKSVNAKLEQELNDAREGKAQASSQIKGLENQIEALQRIITDKEGEIAKVRKVQRQLEHEKVQFKEHGDALGKDNVELCEKLEKLNEECFVSKEKIREYDFRQTELIAKLQDLELSKTAKHNELEELKRIKDGMLQELTQVLQDNQHLEAKSTSLSEELSNANKSFEELKAKNDTYLVELAEKKKAIEAVYSAKKLLQQEYEKTRKQADELNLKNREISTANTKLSAECRHMEELGNKSKIEINRLTLSSKNAKQEASKLLTRLENKDKELEELALALNHRQFEINRLIEERNEHKANIISLTNKVEEASRHCTQLNSEVNEHREIMYRLKTENNFLQDAIAKGASEKVELEKKIVDRKDEIKEVRELCSKLENEKRDLESVCDQEKKHNEEIKFKLKDLQLQFARLETDKSDLSKIITQQDIDNEKFQAELSALEAKYERGEGQWLADKEQLHTLLSKKKTLEDQRSALEDTLSRVECALEDVRSKYNISEIRVETLVKQVADYEHIISDLQNEIAKRDEMYHEMEEEKRKLLHEQEIMSVAHEELEQEKQVLNEHKDRLVEKLNEVAAHSEQYQRNFEGSERECKQAKEELATNVTKFDAMERKIRELRRDNEQLEASYRQVVEANKDLISDKGILESAKSNFSLESKRLVERERCLEQENKELKAELTSLIELNKKMLAEKDNLYTANVGYMQEFKILENSAKHLEQDNAKYRAKIQEVEQDKQRQVDSVSKLAQENKQLKGDFNKTQRACSMEQKQVQQLVQQKEAAEQQARRIAQERDESKTIKKQLEDQIQRLNAQRALDQQEIHRLRSTIGPIAASAPESVSAPVPVQKL